MKNELGSKVSGLISILAAGVIMTSCAGSPNRKDCEAQDFYQMGLTDGQNGKTTERFQRMADSCKAAGVEADPSKYNYGRQVGLAKFCDADAAKKDVGNGKGDSVCLREHVPPYETAYHQEITRRKQLTQNELQDIKKSQDKLQVKNSKIQTELNQLNTQDAQVKDK